jgi:hypothetical protein
MRRHNFITLPGRAAMALSLLGRAQQGGAMQRVGVLAAVAGLFGWLMALTTAASAEPARRMPTVGVLNYAAARDGLVVQFLYALRELGYVEGKTSRWCSAMPKASSSAFLSSPSRAI